MEGLKSVTNSIFLLAIIATPIDIVMVAEKDTAVAAQATIGGQRDASLLWLAATAIRSAPAIAKV